MKKHVLIALILSHHCWGRITSEVIPCLLAKKDHCDIYKFLVRGELERYENNLRDTAEKKTGVDVAENSPSPFAGSPCFWTAGEG